MGETMKNPEQLRGAEFYHYMIANNCSQQACADHFGEKQGTISNAVRVYCKRAMVEYRDKRKKVF